MIRTGTVTGTGAAINISIGYLPVYVKVINITDGNAIEWCIDMGAGKGLKTKATPSQAMVAANGISTFAGTTTAGEGFTIGTDADINAAGKTLVWLASRDNRR